LANNLIYNPPGQLTGGLTGGHYPARQETTGWHSWFRKSVCTSKNSYGIHEVKISSPPLEGHDRLNTPDLGGNGKLKPAEAAAAQLESAIGTMERYAPPPGAKSGTSPDFVITLGKNKGKTVDAMYTTDKLSQKEIDGLNKFYEKNMNSGNGKVVIQKHLKKADFVPVDFRILTPVYQKIFMDYVVRQHNPTEWQKMAEVVWEEIA
jgi:filamentous hemagglutinin